MLALDQNQTKQESLPRRQTDPLWIQDYFLSTGHNETTPNATATFVKRNGRHYMITCEHVLETVTKSETIQGPRTPRLTMALEVNREFMNFAFFTVEGLDSNEIRLKPTVRAPKAAIPSSRFDIALAEIRDDHWERLSRRKNKVAIDLDSWREPNWSDVQLCLAAGYPTEHKEKITLENGSEKIATPFLRVLAQLAPTFVCNKPKFALSSRLDNPHGWNFSGMSGGPVYAIEGSEDKDESLFPIGIIFEGYPSRTGAAERSREDTVSGFLTDQDLFFRALTLTPETFDEWLKGCG